MDLWGYDWTSPGTFGGYQGYYIHKGDNPCPTDSGEGGNGDGSGKPFVEPNDVPQRVGSPNDGLRDIENTKYNQIKQEYDGLYKKPENTGPIPPGNRPKPSPGNPDEPQWETPNPIGDIINDIGRLFPGIQAPEGGRGGTLLPGM